MSSLCHGGFRRKYKVFIATNIEMKCLIFPINHLNKHTWCDRFRYTMIYHRHQREEDNHSLTTILVTTKEYSLILFIHRRLLTDKFNGEMNANRKLIDMCLSTMVSLYFLEDTYNKPYFLGRRWWPDMGCLLKSQRLILIVLLSHSCST